VSVAAVVLAAGSGSRFPGGVHKLRARFRGRPVVCWAVDAALGAGLDETVVVTGAADLEDLLPGTVTVLRNESWQTGQASSLRCALDWCSRAGHEAAVVGLGDQPLVPASAWRAVAARSGPIVVCSYAARAGLRSPPVRLGREVWDLVPFEGDEGARALMRRRPDLVVAVACEGDPTDIDTPEDLEAWS
jgi:molybdenum cofactor cytidylyltransferase